MQHQDWKEVIVKKPKKIDYTSNYSRQTSETVKLKLLDSIDDVPQESKSNNFKFIGSQIIQARTSKNLKQVDLAKLINKQSKDIQEFENGKKRPDESTIVKLNKVLNTIIKIK